VGSNSNAGERGMEVEAGRAAIWEIDRTTARTASSRQGCATRSAWRSSPRPARCGRSVNERDELGSDLVPDYLTSVKDGGFYGWPYSYYGAHMDERVKPQRPDLAATAIVPDYALGAHTAALGLARAWGDALPATFASGMFVGQHGSWNRKPPSGYQVVFVPFKGGKPSGQPIPVLTGFLSPDRRGVRAAGRRRDRQPGRAAGRRRRRQRRLARRRRAGVGGGAAAIARPPRPAKRGEGLLLSPSPREAERGSG
jgi:glucose/arabinose dehydrogenase